MMDYFHYFVHSTPPSRASAFEEFKSERGSEINRILVENKGITNVLHFIALKRVCRKCLRDFISRVSA